jgi:TPP-dependent indolepyruvate ferredoxin oxidoreductase alpha subunit
MKRALIHPERCTNCQPCIAQLACERQAIFREAPADKPWVDFYRCSGCLKCKATCPASAIQEISQPCDGQPRAGW